LSHSAICGMTDLTN